MAEGNPSPGFPSSLRSSRRLLESSDPPPTGKEQLWCDVSWPLTSIRGTFFMKKQRLSRNHTRMFDKRIGQVKCSPSYGSTLLYSPPTLVQSTCSPVRNNKQMLNKTKKKVKNKRSINSVYCWSQSSKRILEYKRDHKVSQNELHKLYREVEIKEMKFQKGTDEACFAYFHIWYKLQFLALRLSSRALLKP